MLHEEYELCKKRLLSLMKAKGQQGQLFLIFKIVV
jgi:hypothetical protein